MSRAPDNIGGIASLIDALRPNNQAAAASFALKGLGIDTEKFQSLLFMISAGAATGSPSAVTVDVKLQHSDDDVDGNYTDVAAHAFNTEVTKQLTAVNTRKYLEVMKTQTLKKFVRLVFTVAFTGGTSPTVGLQATACIGGHAILPPVHA
jgi:hypothetical protein